MKQTSSTAHRPFSDMTGSIGHNSDIGQSIYDRTQLNMSLEGGFDNFNPNQNFSPQFVITGEHVKVKNKPY